MTWSVTDIGIVGLASFYGPAYADRAAATTGVDITGAVARRSDEDLSRLGRPTRSDFEEAYGCQLFDSVDELADEVDALVVASRTTRRAEDAVTALEAGCPVLTAKPVGATVADARAVASAASSETPAVTTCPARFDDGLGELAARVHDGAVGEVVAVRGAIRHDRVPEAGIDVNAEHAPGEAGAVYAMGYYTADLLLWLADGTPEQLSGTLGNVNTSHSTHPDLGSATVVFDDGAQGTMDMTYCADCRERLGNWEVEVVGTDGVMRTVHHGYEGLHWHAGDTDERRTEAFGRTQSPILDRQFDAFLRTVEDNTYGRFVPDPKTVAEAIELCAAWERAAQSDRSVTLP